MPDLPTREVGREKVQLQRRCRMKGFLLSFVVFFLVGLVSELLKGRREEEIASLIERVRQLSPYSRGIRNGK